MELVKERLFQYTVIWHPTKDQSKEGQKSKLVVEPALALATDEKAISMKAIKAIPTAYDAQLDQIEVAVRPF